MKKIPVCSSYKRDKIQEGGAVLRWSEGCGNILSVVKGQFHNEAEIRFSSDKAGSFDIRGGESTILRKLDRDPKKRINELIKRENTLSKGFR